MEQRTVQRMNYFIFLCGYFGQHFAPWTSVHARCVCMQFALQHFHDIRYASGIVKIYYRIRAARYDCIDARDFLGIMFKVFQCQFDSQFVCIRQQMQYRIG